MLAAYAFVLNALLATTLLAATPPAKSLSGFELCTAAADTASPIDHADTATKRAAVHCQICLQHTSPVALPPPAAAALPLALVQVAAFAAVHTDAPLHERRFSSHHPRGPPQLN